MAFGIYKIHDAGTRDELFTVQIDGRMYDFRVQVNYITGFTTLDLSYNDQPLITGVHMADGSVAMNQSYGIACEVWDNSIYVAVKENTSDNRGR